MASFNVLFSLCKLQSLLCCVSLDNWTWVTIASSNSFRFPFEKICVEFSKRMANQVNIDESIAGVVKKFENY